MCTRAGFVAITETVAGTHPLQVRHELLLAVHQGARRRRCLPGLCAGRLWSRRAGCGGRGGLRLSGLLLRARAEGRRRLSAGLC